MDELADQIVAFALDQADDVAALDAPWAEAWASDLVAMARESLGPDGPDLVVDRLVSVGGHRAATVLVAVGAITEGPASRVDIGALGESPRWADVAGTSECRAAFEVRNRRGCSLVFRFVDSADGEHLLVVDVVPGPPEHLGEVHIAGGDLFDAFEEDDADVEALVVAIETAADRVAAALAATERPRMSAVINGQLLVARLAPLTDVPLDAPEPVADDVQPAPDLDPDDARFALELFDRAIGRPTTAAAVVGHQLTLAAVAERLRAAARADEPLAVWLAASVGPVDLDETDDAVVVAALAATIAPRRLEPLDPSQREATVDLEWADWLGALIELCREGAGAPVDPSGLVDRVNRCPEVSTSVPAGDRPRVEWAFAVMTDPWRQLGVVDDGALSELGAVLIPVAVHSAWAGDRW